MSVLGLDIGTTGSRAVIVNDAGTVLAGATEPHAPFESPQPGWAEQHPADWWRAARAAVARVVADDRVQSHDIRAVGLSGQMHGAVLENDADEVLRPAIIWCDQRTDAECRWLRDTIGAARVIELVSNPALTGFTLPKLLWVRTHEPQVWDEVRSVLLPKDYVRLQLTGERATDAADASGTLLFDVANRCWSTPMLEATGIDATWLPAVYEGPEVTGRVTARAARDTGLPAGTPVVAGGGDQAAGAVGMGIVRPGTVSATIGTSGVVFAATDRPVLDPGGRVHTFCHAVPGRWHVMGVTQGAGLSLRWFKDTFGAGPAGADDGRDPYDRLCDEAAGAPPGAAGVLWTPYLMGERTPHLDPHARAALVGLTASHTRAHIIRAVLEGVAFSLRDSFTVCAEMGVPVHRIRLGGGGARSALWRQIQADVYGHQVEILAAEEGAAYGAALLAGVGAGVWNSVDDACDAVVRVRERIDPDPEASACLSEHYARFRAVYPALHPRNAHAR
ncbi:MAG: xylulokinase [Acidobacteria bacterium]|nr:xylulokinase [Acidobacteriota bacterium]